jgi:hypothetical protein
MKENQLLPNSNNEITEYEFHFNRFKNEYYRVFEDNFSTIEKGFTSLVKKYLKLLQEKEDDNIYNAWDFSLFNIIKVKRPEENLHSPLLIELLDTEGKHGQQDLFYKLFIKFFINENSDLFINDNPKDYYLKKEEFIETDKNKGRIDIFIKSINPKKKFAILLENKWDSGDSCPDQLFKYYNSLIKRHGYTDKNLLVFYLTKNGNDPTWIENKDFDHFLKSNKGLNYFPISYNEHIFNWLTECMFHCKSEKIKFIIEQYKKHIYGLNN